MATVVQPGPAAWRGRRHTGASSRHQCTQSPTILCARLSRRQRQRLAAGIVISCSSRLRACPWRPEPPELQLEGPSMGGCDPTGHSPPAWERRSPETASAAFDL